MKIMQESSKFKEWKFISQDFADLVIAFSFKYCPKTKSADIESVLWGVCLIIDLPLKLANAKRKTRLLSCRSFN